MCTGREVDVSETTERSPEVTGPAARGPGQSSRGWALVRRSAAVFARQREATIFVVLVALVLYFGLTTSAFLTNSNVTNLLSGYAAPIIIKE